MALLTNMFDHFGWQRNLPEEKPTMTLPPVRYVKADRSLIIGLLKGYRPSGINAREDLETFIKFLFHTTHGGTLLVLTPDKKLRKVLKVWGNVIESYTRQIEGSSSGELYDLKIDFAYTALRLTERFLSYLTLIDGGTEALSSSEMLSFIAQDEF